ncbi:hypothetical protein GW17_00030870, partial [Ensete ventricosum]
YQSKQKQETAMAAVTAQHQEPKTEGYETLTEGSKKGYKGEDSSDLSPQGKTTHPPTSSRTTN